MKSLVSEICNKADIKFDNDKELQAKVDEWQGQVFLIN